MKRRHFLGSSLLSAATARLKGQMVPSQLAPEATGSLAKPGAALPEFEGAADWFNASPLRRRALRGSVVLVNFWTYSCINSLRPLPYLRAWAAQYKNEGLVVVGVHTPEFAFEKDRANVEWAIRQFGISYPVAMDNEYRIWRAFQNNSWPAFYIADPSGHIRYSRFGEGQYDQSERLICALLKQKGSVAPVKAEGIEAAPGNEVRTPETYVGFRRADPLRVAERLGRDARKVYNPPDGLSMNQWAFSGTWQVGAESALVREAGAKLLLRFHSRDLHLVLAPDQLGQPVSFRVTLDGTPPASDAGVDSAPDGLGVIREPRLYQLIRQNGAVRARQFAIEFLRPGARAYSFTFG